MSSIWDNCLTKLENEIASSDFSTWIRPLQALENQGQIKLLAPNRFVLDWVKQHYFSKIEESVRGFAELVDGKVDDLPEQAFYMKGNIDEVLEAAEQMKAKA